VRSMAARSRKRPAKILSFYNLHFLADFCSTGKIVDDERSAESAMRASSAVTLFLLSGASIFGIVTSHSPRETQPSVAPVWVNGVMGVWDPDTGQFVPVSSPQFNQTCERIQRKRDLANGYYYSGSSYSGHHWYFSPESNSYSYSNSSFFGSRSSGGSGWSSGEASSGSARGGIGATGSSHGGHGGGE
jgi:hypothetical protein